MIKEIKNNYLFGIKLLLTITVISSVLLTCLPAAALQLINPANTTAQDEAFLDTSGYGAADKLSLARTMAAIIKTVLSLLGVIFIILIIYAGFIWTTSSGEEDKINKAKKMIASAVVGLFIILAAYAITIFVIDRIVGATVGGGGTEGGGGGFEGT